MHEARKVTHHHVFLISLVLALVAIVLSFLLYVVQASHARAMEQGAQQAANLASLLEERVRAAFQSADFLLDDVALHVDMQKGLPDPQSESGKALRKLLFDKWQRGSSLANIGFLDPMGRIQYTMLGDGSVSQAGESYLAELGGVRAPEMAMSSPQVMPQLHEPGVLMGRAVRDEGGKLAAVSVGWLRSSYFDAMFAPLKLGPQGIVVLTDDHYRLIARHPELPDFPVGSQYGHPHTETGPLPDTSILVSELDGTRRITAWRRLQDYHVVLVVGIAETDALAEWRTQTLRYFLVGLVVCLFGAALTIMLLNAARQAERLSESEALLRESEARHRQIIELAPAAMVQVSGTPPAVTYANRDFEQLFGREHGEAAGHPVVELFVDPSDATRLLDDAAKSGGIHERELQLTDGRHNFWGLVSATALPGVGGQGFLLGFADIDARKVLEHRLTVEASTDALTGLANRRYFFARSEAACDQARRYHRPLSVVVMDIDKFKAVNDNYGHHVGDAVLERAARILQVTLRQPDLPARIGGEEFVALLPETSLQQAMEAAERIRQAIEDAPLTLEDGRLVAITASFGVAAYKDEDDIHPAIDRADEAMYRAKQGGRNRVEIAIA
ncbi:MAG: diguanylate cyclase [Burkholderiales bacterium]|nr:diguanylate cyclase [Burkholderiales bacterium]